MPRPEPVNPHVVYQPQLQPLPLIDVSLARNLLSAVEGLLTLVSFSGDCESLMIIPVKMVQQVAGSAEHMASALRTFQDHMGFKLLNAYQNWDSFSKASGDVSKLFTGEVAVGGEKGVASMLTFMASGSEMLASVKNMVRHATTITRQELDFLKELAMWLSPACAIVEGVISTGIALHGYYTATKMDGTFEKRQAARLVANCALATLAFVGAIAIGSGILTLAPVTQRVVCALLRTSSGVLIWRTQREALTQLGSEEVGKKEDIEFKKEQTALFVARMAVNTLESLTNLAASYELFNLDPMTSRVMRALVKTSTGFIAVFADYRKHRYTKAHQLPKGLVAVTPPEEDAQPIFMRT